MKSHMKDSRNLGQMFYSVNVFLNLFQILIHTKKNSVSFKHTVRAADRPEYERAQLRAVPVLRTVVVMVMMMVVVVVPMQVLGFYSVALAIFPSVATSIWNTLSSMKVASLSFRGIALSSKGFLAKLNGPRHKSWQNREL